MNRALSFRNLWTAYSTHQSKSRWFNYIANGNKPSNTSSVGCAHDIFLVQTYTFPCVQYQLSPVTDNLKQITSASLKKRANPCTSSEARAFSKFCAANRFVLSKGHSLTKGKKYQNNQILNQKKNQNDCQRSHWGLHNILFSRRLAQLLVSTFFWIWWNRFGPTDHFWGDRWMQNEVAGP